MVLSGQVPKDGMFEWHVDWAAPVTWWKFAGLCALIAFVLLLGNMGPLGIARLVASYTLASGIDTTSGLTEPAVDLPLTYKWIPTLAAWFALIEGMNRLVGKASVPAIPDGFPMDASEKGKESFAWLVLLIALFTWLFLAAGRVSLGPFSVTGDNWDTYGLWCFAPIVGKQGIRRLFWWVLASGRPPSAPTSAEQSWIARDPAKIIAVIAAICVVALLLTTLLYRGWT